MKNKNDLLVIIIFILMNLVAFLIWNEWSFSIIGFSIVMMGLYLKIVILRRIANRSNIKDNS